MKKLFLLPLLAVSLLPNLAHSATCAPANLADFAAYASESMDVRQSDHEGLSGAGVNLFADHFLFQGQPANCLAISAGSYLQFHDGSTGETIEAARAEISRVNVSHGRIETIDTASLSNVRAKRARISALAINHSVLAGQIAEASRQMGGYPNTLKPTVENDFFVARLKSGTNVFSFSDSDLRLRPRLVLDGPSDALVVINVNGQSVNLDGMNVIRTGGIIPTAIRWNFVNATAILIVRTADAEFGIPGILLAPYANVEFYEGLITGSLFVKNLVFNEGRGLVHSGQINRYPRIPGARPLK